MDVVVEIAQKYRVMRSKMSQNNSNPLYQNFMKDDAFVGFQKNIINSKVELNNCPECFAQNHPKNQSCHFCNNILI